MLKTINESIILGRKVEIMDKSAMFKGFNKDDFHINMIEDQMIGLSYYLCIATDMYATSNS